MIDPKPLMRRGEVADWLLINYGMSAHRVRVLIEEGAIKARPKLYKKQKQAYYSREQIMEDVVRKCGLDQENRESSTAGSAVAHNVKGQS